MTDLADHQSIATETVRFASYANATLDSIYVVIANAGERYSKLTVVQWEEARNDAVALIYHIEASDALAGTVPDLIDRVTSFAGRADRLLARIDELGLSRWPAVAEAAGAKRVDIAA